MAALNAGGFAVIFSVSCAGAGDCAAGGQYRDGSGDWQAFVVSETSGAWGNAIEVPGTAALNGGGDARVYSLSCGAVGDCAAGGWYTDGSGDVQAWVANETNGTWGNATEVAGTATLNSGGSAYVSSISCVAAGDCAAGGSYTDGSGNFQAFVVSERNGTWGNATEVPGTAALDSGGDASVGSVSCAAVDNCVVGGWYLGGSGAQSFVVSETNGVWGHAVEVPGTAALNSGNNGGVSSVSCPEVGDCAVVGGYRNGDTSTDHAYVVNEKNGVWADAFEIPGTASLNVGGMAHPDSVSCAAPGDCAAVGYYADASGHFQTFVVDEKNGVWGQAVEAPGTAVLNVGNAFLLSVSCGAPGDCAAGGWYQTGPFTNNPDPVQAFVVSETNGVWGHAIEVPGSAGLNTGGDGTVWSVSCASAGDCAAGGEYRDGSGDWQAFVVSSHAAGLRWSQSRGGQTITSYDFGAVDGGSTVSTWFRLGSSGPTKSRKLSIGLTGSPAFSITEDRCTGKSIGPKLSCWVSVAYAPLGSPTSDSATLRATDGHGADARLTLSGENTGP